MTVRDVDNKFVNARKEFKNWKNLSIDERANLLFKAADILNDRKIEIANMMTMEIAKSNKDCIEEIERTIKLIKYSAEEGKRIFGQTINGSAYSKNSKIAIVKKEPLGIILAISPFNYPINLSASKIAPALISGNVVVFKPPTQGVLSATMLYNCFIDAGISKKVLSLVTGKGSEIGNYLNTHSEIDFINFTGSTQIGKQIASQTVMKGMLFELGGKDAAIVLKDADIELSAKKIVQGAYSYSGQRCTAIKRVLVESEIADKLVKKILENVIKLKVGDPRDNVDIVPLIDKKTVDYIIDLKNDAINKGAKLLTKFEKKDNLIWPLLLDYVTLDSKLAWEEPFGPILPIIRVNDKYEAIKIANKSNYGLQSSVFTKNIDDAMYIANSLEVGTVHINDKTQRGPDNFPFLGIKDSGFGVQGIRDSILSMMTIKNIVFDMEGE